MNKLILYTPISIDGKIGTLDDKSDWLDLILSEIVKSYENFYTSIDYVLLGRKTYDLLIDDFPYSDKKIIVLGNKKTEIKTSETTLINNLSELDKYTGNIWLLGGKKLILSAIEKNLIDSYILTSAPVILGEGIEVFNSLKNKLSLKLVKVKEMGEGLQLTYEKRN